MEAYTEGPNDCGIDAVFIQRNSDQPQIHIMQSKFHQSERKSINGFKASTLDRISRFMEIVKDRTIDLDKVCNSKLVQKIYEIRDLQDKDFPEFKVWLLSNGSPCVEHEAAPIMKSLTSKGIVVEQFHLLELVEFCIKRRSSRTDHIFQIRDVGYLDHGDSNLKSMVAFVSARELYGLIKDIRNERKIDYTVFDMNVRGFLGSGTIVNQEIFKSADNNNNRLFECLNNGITIIGSDFKIMASSDQPKVGIKNMNIVNGAQTCSAVFDAMKQYYPDFSRFNQLSILIRVFATDDTQLISKIALSTNSQNKINPRDLKANEHEQILLERKLQEEGIQYIRKRGEYDEFPSELIELDALKAGQIILAFIHYEPAQAKRDSDGIFADNYGKIFHNVDIDKLVEGFSIYQMIIKRKDEIEENIRIKGVNRTENTFVTYGSFHILMLCSIGKILKPSMSRTELIDNAISIISKVLKKQGHPAYYSFFRNPTNNKILIDEMQQPNLLDLIETNS